MAKPTKQETTTGSGIGLRSPILAGSDEGNTEGKKKHAPIPSGSASITAEERLSLLQTDLLDLQSRGFTVAILAEKGRLVIGITHSLVALGFDGGHITFGGVPVTQAEK